MIHDSMFYKKILQPVFAVSVGQKMIMIFNIKTNSDQVYISQYIYQIIGAPGDENVSEPDKNMSNSRPNTVHTCANI